MTLSDRRSARRGSRPTASRARNEALRGKYDSLLAKYEGLVTKYRDDQHDRLATVRLAFWTLRNRTSGVALLQDGKLMAVNPRWRELEAQDRSGRWVRTGGDGEPEPPHASLSELALHHAGRIASGAPSVTSAVYELQGGAAPRFVSVLFDQPGQVRNEVFVLVQDATRAVLAERELEAARRASEVRERLELLGKLASSIAHDFNNSLFALTLQLERLIATSADPALKRQLGEILAVVQGDAQRVRQLQDFARRRTRAPTRSVDLCQVVREAAALAREHLAHRNARGDPGIQLELALPERAMVRGDGSELRPVILNLLLNARDAMPRGGTGRVEVRRQARQVLLEVTDQGTGIPAAVIEHIFDPLFTTKPGQGSGLGLSTAAGVMERLGGRIEAFNRSEGGALLRLTFPRSRAAAAQPARPRRGEAAAARRILVVDDEPDVLHALQGALARHRVEVATSGTEALARLGQGADLDLVLCDLGLPDLDGFQVAEALRARAPGLPVVILTGWGDQLARDDRRRRLVAEVLAKPVGVEDLEAVVARATSTGRRRDR